MTTAHLILYRHGRDRYALTFTPEQRDEALQALGRWACNKELSFDWHDATQMARKIREIMR